MFTLCNPNMTGLLQGEHPKFGAKVTHPPVDLSVGDIRSQIAAEWLQIAQQITVILVHLILHISPHHSHHLHSHHLSLPLHFTPDLKLISFTNPFLHSHSYSFRTDFTDLNLY